MISKSELLNNLREYTSDQIAEAIDAGIVTIYELSKSGQLTPLMRRRIEERLAAKQTEESLSMKEAPSLDSSGGDYEEDVYIQETPDTDVSSEITIAQDSVIESVADSASIETEPGEISTDKKPEDISNKGMFKHPFSFDGRIRRTEYGISFIIYYVWSIVINVMMEKPEPSIAASLFVLISFIPMVWFLWAQGAKRCHDRGNSGWYQLIPFYVFFLLFGEGEEGVNKYGDNPKE